MTAAEWMTRWQRGHAAAKEPKGELWIHALPLEMLLNVPLTIFVAEKLSVREQLRADDHLLGFVYKRGDDHGHNAMGLSYYGWDPGLFTVWRRKDGTVVGQDFKTLEEARVRMREFAEEAGWL